MKAKKSEIKQFLKEYSKFDKYIIDSFIEHYENDGPNYYKSLEDAYKDFNNNSPIFHECGLSDVAQKTYPVRLYYDDNGYHFLDDERSAIINSYHFVYRFKNMEDAIEYTKRNPREKKDYGILSLAQKLNTPKKSALQWWVLKTENAYDSIENVRSPSEGGLYRNWAATYKNSQVIYHHEQYYWEGSGWERSGYGPTEVHEIPDDFYERYREVKESECSQGSGAWYCNWNFSKSDKVKSNKVKTDKKQKIKEAIEEPKNTQDIIIDKIAELKAKSVISDEVADVLDLIVSYIATKSDIDHNHNE